MLSVFDGLRDITFWTVAFRLCLAFLCGGAVGLERSYKNRPAGFRTHILICIGASMAAMTGLYLYLNAHISTDISRIGAQVVSGLGFIGAGTIVVTKKPQIKGLTTAAGLWASGIIGLALGAGFYEGGLTATVLLILTEICFARVGKRIRYTPEFRMTLHYRDKLALDRAMRLCKDRKLSVADLRVTGTSEGAEPVYTVLLTLRQNGDLDREELLEEIRSDPAVLGAGLLEEDQD